MNDINTLEKVQREAARFVLEKYQQRESQTDMMKDLKWNKLQERRLVARQTMLHKIVNKTAAVQIPYYISEPRQKQQELNTVAALLTSELLRIATSTVFPPSV